MYFFWNLKKKYPIFIYDSYEIIDNNFTYGNVSKPSFGSKCRLINKEDLEIVLSE